MARLLWATTVLQLAAVIGVVAARGPRPLVDYSPSAVADLIETLPGSEGLPITFNQFSGMGNDAGQGGVGLVVVL